MFAKAFRGNLRSKGMRRIAIKMCACMLIVVQLLGSTALINISYGATAYLGTVTTRSGNVREKASITSPVVFCVSKDDQLTILSEEKAADGSSWAKVLSGDKVGYIRSDLISKTDKTISVNNSVITDKKDEKPEDNKDTSKVTDDSKKDQTDSKNEKKDSNDSKKGTIKGTSVRMRSGATTDSSVVTYLENGSEVVILGTGKASDGQVWYQVKASDKTGFVRSDLIETDEPKEDNKSTSEGEVTIEEKPAADNGVIIEEEQDKEEVTVEEDAYSAGTDFDSSKYEPGKGTIKGSSVRIREAASLTSNVITTAVPGTSYPVIGEAEGDGRKWCIIVTTADGKTTPAYVAADYIEITEPIKEKEATEDAKQEEENTAAENTTEETQDNSKHASVKGVGVRVRVTPVTGNVICQLSNGHPCVVVGEESGEDGTKWYHITFSYMGSSKEGYIREDFITFVEIEDNETAPIGDEEFENSIAALPGSYKNSLRTLHAAHPAWKFEAVDTGLDWNEALTAESSVGKNLVTKNSVASWKSTATQAYNWANNTWYTFDGGSWVSASPELIAYYMDPRNFLNESGIYQFESLNFDASQSVEGISKMLTGTFMSESFVDTDGATYTYADVFRQAGEQMGVSPYLLAGRALQEQGVDGTSQSIAGNVAGYEGIFNYFNVGAYAYSGRSATINGLIYAKGSDEAGYRPWNTRVKSIYGGTKYIADKFVSVGQNTLYFQKFNVVNSENQIYSHQYMSNIQAASSESARLQLAYLGGDEALTFRIPFYKNMPETSCVKPTSDSSPNTYLSALSVDGCELSPAFSGVTENYTVKVADNAEYITISASAVSSSSSVGGVGTFQLSNGNGTYSVVCKAQNGATKTYTIKVKK